MAIVYLLLAVLLYFLDSRGTLGSVHSATQALTTPVRSFLFNTKQNILSPLSVFSDSSKQEQRVKELEEKNASLSAQLAKLTGLQEENEKMRRLLGTDLPPSWQFATARVVTVTADTLVLTSDHAPQDDTSVITTKESGIFVGRVQEVKGKEVQILLPSHSSSKIPVIVRDSESGLRQASGIGVGRGGRAVLEQVLTSEQIKEGDLILTSGEGGVPEELLLGYVAEVSRVEGAAWQQAEIKSAVDLDDLDFVFFVTKF